MLLRWLRHRLTAVTTIWLFCQVLSLSALAPRYCCAAHGHAGESEAAGHPGGAGEDCHQEATIADHCPMAGANGEACPMHGGGLKAGAADSHPGHEHPSTPARAIAADSRTATDLDDCVMRATCQGPVTALASLIWIPGILAATQSAPIDQIAPLTPPAAAAVTSSIRPIDLPPPRV